MRVLFVGNSYIYFNDLPGLLAHLAAAGGVTLAAESVAEGGMTLLGHLRHGQAASRIRTGGWGPALPPPALPGSARWPSVRTWGCTGRTGPTRRQPARISRPACAWQC